MKHRIVTHFTALSDQPSIVCQEVAGNIIQAIDISVQFDDELSNLFSTHNGQIVDLTINAPICLTGKLVKWLNITRNPISDTELKSSPFEYFELVKISNI